MSFLTTFAGALVAAILLVLLVDPYGVVPFSLPIRRPIVSQAQRHEYPKIVRSGEFDSFIVGTSTARLLDPEILNPLFHARFANLAMNSASAWEQARMIDFVRRHVGETKVLIIGVDWVWCAEHPARTIGAVGEFPEWLYDDNPWNDYAPLVNEPTVEVAVRIIGNHLGLYPEQIRSDGFEVLAPPERDYDPARARHDIWGGEPRKRPADQPLPLSAQERRRLEFPALPWLEEVLGKFPTSTLKILAYMPVHVAAQPWPGTLGAAQEAECKDRIAAMARQRGAIVIDWRIRSPITTEDRNYWDSLHYRLNVAQRIARELAAAALEGIPSQEGDYRLVVR